MAERFGDREAIVRFLSSFSDAMVISVWFGLVAGLLEGIAKAVQWALPDVVIRASPEILWIAPAFNLALFLPIGTGVSLLLFLPSGKEHRARVTVTLFIWVILFGALLMVGTLHQVPALVLSLGVAFQLGRWAQAREQRMLSCFRRSVVVLAVVALFAGVAGASWDDWQEQRLVSQLPEADREAPNLLLIIFDTLRADHVSAYGYRRATTPNIDRLARGGVLFERAFANSSWTLPSHASMFTGRFPYEHKADWDEPLNATYPTLAEELAERGYLTAAFSANTHYVSPEWGLGRGFAHFEVYGSSLADDAMRTIYGRKLALNVLPRLGYYDIPGRKRAAEVNRELFRWLDGVGERPFFAFLNYFDLHDPYLTVDPYHTKFSTEVTRGDLINHQLQVIFRRKRELTPQQIQMEINGYDGTVAYVDAQLGVLLSELARRDLIENTVVIVTSDHGEAFGNHDLFGHGNSLYLETLHVPLVFYWPGRIPADVRVSRVVSLHQLPATMMELLGEGESTPFPGESLAKLWSGNMDVGSTASGLAELSPGRFKNASMYPTAEGELSSLVTDQWQVIIAESGHAELYAWSDDRQEARNLADSAEGQVLVREFRQYLQTLLASTPLAEMRTQ